MSSQDSLGFLIADISRLMRQSFRSKEHEGCLSLSQAKALLFLARYPGIKQVELAELLEIKPITLAKLLDQLAALSLIERRKDPEDRRAHKVYLTDEATPLLAKFREIGAHLKEVAVTQMTDEEINQLMLLLGKMRQSLTTYLSHPEAFNGDKS